MIYFRDRLYLFEDEENKITQKDIENAITKIAKDADNNNAKDLLSFIANDNNETTTTDSSTTDSSIADKSTEDSAKNIINNAKEVNTRILQDLQNKVKDELGESFIYYKNNQLN